MNILKDLRKQPFLATVSFAAFIHSAWTFATMFAGFEPKPLHSLDWWAWWFPGAAIAFSVDIGILSIAHRIRHGERSLPTIFVFVTLALGMAYAQFVFMSLHMPSYALASGVRQSWSEGVQLGLDSTLFAFPSFLPIALIMYAFVEKNVKLTSENVSSTIKKEPLSSPNFNETPILGVPVREIENTGLKQRFLPFARNGHENHDATN